MKIVVLGANGFIGNGVCKAFQRAGHDVLGTIRADGSKRPARVDTVPLDFNESTRPNPAPGIFKSADAIVNCVGILGGATPEAYRRIHHDGPLRLFESALDAGAKHIVQVSALGKPEQNEFVASKHELDRELVSRGWPAIILRPSLVMDVSTAWGGTSLLRELARLPVRLLPGDGKQRIQPLWLDDLAELITRLVEPRHRGIDAGPHEVGGPDVMTIDAYQAAWQEWEEGSRSPAVHIPEFLVSAASAVLGRLRPGPLNSTTWKMLREENVVRGPNDLWERAGLRPLSLAEGLRLTSGAPAI